MRYQLSDYEWTAIRSGAPWRDLPENYGPRTTCYNRFVRWRRVGVWDQIMSVVTKTLCPGRFPSWGSYEILIEYRP